VTTLEDRLRDTLNDMAAEAHQVPLLQRLDGRSALRHGRHRRRRMVAFAAATVVAVVTATAAVALRLDRPTIVEPIERPPKVLRLSETPSGSPGRARLVVILARPSPVDIHEDPLYVLPATRDAAIHLPASERTGSSPYSQQLSADGTRLIRVEDSTRYDEPKMEIVNLVTGDVDELGGRVGYCPALSPDNRTVAAYSKTDLHIFDVDTLTPRSVRRVTIPPDVNFCRGLGWSPDGRRVAAPTQSGTVVVDRTGTVQHRWANQSPVNAGSSWSPDSERILLYDARGGSYSIARLDGSGETVVGRPSDAQRPLGWAGSQVVWLGGQPGSYRLIAADPDGSHARTWMEFDLGDRPIATVSWSAGLAGTARR